jgi:hypothetical protein
MKAYFGAKKNYKMIAWNPTDFQEMAHKKNLEYIYKNLIQHTLASGDSKGK